MDNFINVSNKFLDVKLQPLGYILYDDSVMKSTKQQKPFVIEISKSQAAKQLNDIAYALTSSDIEGSDRPRSIKGYIYQMMNFLKQEGLKIRRIPDSMLVKNHADREKIDVVVQSILAGTSNVYYSMVRIPADEELL